MIADLHGRFDLAMEMQSVVLRDIREQRAEKPVVCFVGDYIDRSPQSSQILSCLTGKPFDGLPCVFLKGNHEEWMLSFLKDPEAVGIDWVLNGGADTVESYGINIDDDPDDAGWLWLRVRLMQADRAPFISPGFAVAFVWDRGRKGTEAVTI